MANNDELVPKNPNEVVVPIGQANLITTQEEVDKALKTASHIFRKQEEAIAMEHNDLNTQLETSLNVDSEGDAATVDTLEIPETELVELTSEELAALPAAKFGRDNFGRALNKGGTPRKKRNDKGVKRGAYGPRTPKSQDVNEPPPTPAPIAVAAENTTSDLNVNDNIF